MQDNRDPTLTSEVSVGREWRKIGLKYLPVTNQ